MTRTEAIEVKERPILFSAPMIRAILDGRKTQTRRIIKGVPPETVKLKLEDGWLRTFVGDVMDLPESDPDAWTLLYSDWERGYGCPYGGPGDRLWVRETFCVGYHLGDGRYTAFRWDGCDEVRDRRAFYAATSPEKPDEPRMPWTPSIHMPRWACRILLEITDVRVQRVQEISDADAVAEGMTDNTCQRHHFQELWESIHGAGSWTRNDWVWAITFRRVQP